MDLDSMRGLHTDADDLIRSMYLGRVGWSSRERAHELKLRAVFASARDDAGATAALHRLIHGLKSRSRLVAIEPVLGGLGPRAGNTGLDAILHLARAHEQWLQDPEMWMASGEDARGQLGSLARHLFAIYPLPPYLDAAWLAGFSDDAEAERHWFMHLGRGDKLEAIRFPTPMTHRAAHHFLHAPNDFTITAAMRYGQIRALGGREALARAVAETCLSELQPDEPFWFTVTQFFVNHPELPLSQIGPVIDYVRGRRSGADGDPTFTMKGRTVAALLRDMEEWHSALARLSSKAPHSWEPCGMRPLEKVQKDPLSAATCRWQVVEITDSMALAEEGREMRHCVRTYQTKCTEGTTSIWSLRLTLSDNPSLRRLLTIQVDNERHAVVQVRGKCNQPLTAMRGNRRMMLARDILREWARTQHLGLSCAL